jgi:hypothetical protein
LLVKVWVLKIVQKRPRLRKVRFHLYIEYEEYLRVYQGTADHVRLVADDGQKVIFPANRLTPFLTHEGISGHFEMWFDQDNKFISMKRLKK